MASYAKYPHFLTITGNNVVKLNLIKTNYDDGLNGVLGQVAAATDAGEVPAGKSQVGVGKPDALDRGCFGIVIVYEKTAKIRQNAIVTVSPSKADTVFSEAKNKKYNGKNIVRAQPKRHRIYSV